jgi:hypothetical protein
MRSSCLFMALQKLQASQNLQDMKLRCSKSNDFRMRAVDESARRYSCGVICDVICPSS